MYVGGSNSLGRSKLLVHRRWSKCFQAGDVEPKHGVLPISSGHAELWI